MKKSIFLLGFLYLFILLNSLVYLDKVPMRGMEQIRAIVSEEMVLTNDYLIPKICHQVYLRKPPLFNWIIAIGGLKDKSISNLEARLPSLIFLILLSFSVYIFLKKENEEKALWAAIITLTSGVTLISYGQQANLDLTFGFLMFIAYIFFIKDKIFLSSLFMGLSILTKGISIIFFYSPFLIYSFMVDNKKKFLKKLGFHFLLSIILPFIWGFIVVVKIGWNSFGETIMFELSDKTIKRSILYALKNAFKFPFKAFLALFPWSLILIAGFKKEINKDKIFITSLLIFSFVFLVLFIFPCGKGRYLTPFVPYFAIISVNFINFNKRIPEVIKNILVYILTFVSIIGGFYIGYKVSIVNGLILAIIGISIYLIINKLESLKWIGLILAIFIFLINNYFFYPLRIKTKFNYKHFAQEVVSILKNKNYINRIIVADNNFKDLKFLFNLERYSKKVVYKNIYPGTKPYIFIINDNSSIKDCKLFLSNRLKRIFIFSCN